MLQYEPITTKKKIAIARLVLRERRPPSPKLSVRLRPQHMRWEVGKYRDRIRSGPGGLGRTKIWTPESVGEQHNLVLDAAYTTLMPSYGIKLLLNCAAVGTGSTAPSATDTALVAEVARRCDIPPPGYVDEITRPANGTYRIQRAREFSPSQVGGQNLTEWGWVPRTSGGPFAVRELFRDGSGNPVTLSLAPDQSLRLIYAVEIVLAPLSQAVSIAITNIGTVAGTMELKGGSNDSGRGGTDFITAEEFMQGNTDALLGGWTSTPPSSGYLATGNPTDMSSLTDLGLGADSRSRQMQGQFGTSQLNGTVYAFGIVGRPSSNWGARPGWIIYLDATFSKDSLHKLLLDPWTLTW